MLSVDDSRKLAVVINGIYYCMGKQIITEDEAWELKKEIQELTDISEMTKRGWELTKIVLKEVAPEATYETLLEKR